MREPIGLYHVCSVVYCPPRASYSSSIIIIISLPRRLLVPSFHIGQPAPRGENRAGALAYDDALSIYYGYQDGPPVRLGHNAFGLA